MLCAVPGAAERDSSLRCIDYGASSITTTVLKTVLQTFGCPLCQVYGMTETTGAIVQLSAEDHDPGYLDAEGYLFLTDRIKYMIVTGAEMPKTATGKVSKKDLREQYS
jgi:acyl-CoA synthetase (AMP-forming)/AMP-acid ligase II